MNQPCGNHGVRFSLRGLLAVIALFAVACAALKFANNAWWIVVSSVAILLLMAMATVALVDRGPRRAFAIGFVTFTLTYGALIVRSGNRNYEVAYDIHLLPSTQQLAALWTLMATEQVVDTATGEAVTDKMPDMSVVSPDDENSYAIDTSNSHAWDLAGSSSPVTEHVVVPDSRKFMRIGHALWAIILGFLGGEFARFVYTRNQRQTEPLDHAGKHP